MTWQRRRHSPPFFSCSSLRAHSCFALVLGRCECRIYVLVIVGLKNQSLFGLGCTDFLHVFLVAARHLSRVLPSNVSVVACPLLSAQASPFPSVFATGPVASSCHEHSEVFEPGIITFHLRFESELNCHQQSVRSVSYYTCILGDDPGYHSNISDAETLCGSRG